MLLKQIIRIKGGFPGLSGKNRSAYYTPLAKETAEVDSGCFYSVYPPYMLLVNTQPVSCFMSAFYDQMEHRAKIRSLQPGFERNGVA